MCLQLRYPNCGCREKDCGGNCCGEDHHFILMDKTPATCLPLGYDRYLCTDCGKIEKRDYVDSLGHAWQSVVIREATCGMDGRLLELCARCGQMRESATPKGEHRYETYTMADTQRCRLKPTTESPEEALRRTACR